MLKKPLFMKFNISIVKNILLQHTQPKTFSPRHPRTAFLKHLQSKYLEAFIWWGVEVYNFLGLRQLAIWASKIVLKFFLLTEIFANSTIFQHFQTWIFKSKIVVKFHVLSFIRSYNLGSGTMVATRVKLLDCRFSESSRIALSRTFCSPKLSLES